MQRRDKQLLDDANAICAVSRRANRRSLGQNPDSRLMLTEASRNLRKAASLLRQFVDNKETERVTKNAPPPALAGDRQRGLIRS